jgi:N4-gp56 family major capsid protein
MASKVIATNDAVTKKLFGEQIWRESLIKPFFASLKGDANSVVETKRNLQASKGDSIKFAYLNKLVGGAKINEQALLGNEMSISDKTMDVGLELVKGAVRYDSDMSVQRAMYDLPSEAKTAIMNWSMETEDDRAFDAIFDGHTNNYWTGTATSSATVANKLTLLDLEKLSVVASTGNGRQFNPLRKVSIDGGLYYIFLCHPNVLFDLTSTDTTWQSAVKEARERGESNPVFKTAEAVWRGIIVMSNERCPIYSNWSAGGNAYGAESMLLGAQSLFLAVGKNSEVVVLDHGYEEERGVAVKSFYKYTKPKFGSYVEGSIQVNSLVTNVTL